MRNVTASDGDDGIGFARRIVRAINRDAKKGWRFVGFEDGRTTKRAALIEEGVRAPAASVTTVTRRSSSAKGIARNKTKWREQLVNEGSCVRTLHEARRVIVFLLGPS